ncbi:MAG TPA: hypothetical protein PKN99_10050, partial [Cyclobacteriaceae bacterium]|nr:hypothetical protein [Cyclobacteriaceae bacterium]
GALNVLVMLSDLLLMSSIYFFSLQLTSIYCRHCACPTTGGRTSKERTWQSPNPKSPIPN